MEAAAGAATTESTPKHPDQQALVLNMAGLRAQLARVIGSADLASDLLQDAVLTTLQKLKAGEISNAARLDGYVYRVALNHLRNHRRKDRSRTADSRRAGEETGAIETAVPTESLEGDQWALLAKRLLKEVTPVRDRELLVRFYLEEESKDALCREFGLTEPHFNRVIYRARNRFRALLQRRGLSKSDFLSIVALLSLLCEGVSLYGA